MERENLLKLKKWWDVYLEGNDNQKMKQCSDEVFGKPIEKYNKPINAVFPPVFPNSLVGAGNKLKRGEMARLIYCVMNKEETK